ncbi:D-aminoacylase [Clostridium sp. PL3]|uniref:D-aminoacylase n=1 Tax=Clostridium thailandense TaxID=2794346 RepID=A0A949U0G5_9CLOT|nr:D-aminoacylase [Clostridium thailandense]MBV7274183.1 D-aminoacylase [Clostridium thailandense]
MMDVLVINGLIVDGTGRRAYHGNIAIKDNKIVGIGKNVYSEANKVIDAAGLVVCPGFIDVHSHNDLVPFMSDKIQNLKLMQGVTTELVGQCGLGVIPCVESKDKVWKNYIKGVVGDPGIQFDFHDFDEYVTKISERGLKNNYAALISHGAVRANVLGLNSRVPTKSELENMCEIVEDVMKKGAFGMSLGLQYMPGIFSDKKELIAMCKIVKKYEGIVMVHLKNHDVSIRYALEEIISIAEASGVKLHISHLRSYDSKDFGCSAELLIETIEKEVDRGIDITFDEHLYLSGSTLMTQLLPPWLTDKGTDVLLKNLKDVRVLSRLKEELVNKEIHYRGWDNYSGIAGWDGILITSLGKIENLKYIGKTIGEIARNLKIHPVDFMANLIVKEQTGVGIVTLDIFSEEDTIKLIRHPLQMVGSDSIPAGVPHPRLYGNFPLFIGKYVRERKALTLEEAVYKATLFPAKRLGMKNVGELSVNKIANITMFSFDEITGYEDYRNSTKNPVGIKHVILNGKIAVENGIVSKEANGSFLKYGFN